MSAQPTWSRYRPAERPRSARKLLRRGELCHRRAPQNPPVRVHAAVQQHLAKRRQIRRGAENSRVSRHAANRERIFVVHFTLHQAVRSEEHTSELQSLTNLVCRLLLEKKKKKHKNQH